MIAAKEEIEQVNTSSKPADEQVHSLAKNCFLYRKIVGSDRIHWWWSVSTTDPAGNNTCAGRFLRIDDFRLPWIFGISVFLEALTKRLGEV